MIIYVLNKMKIFCHVESNEIKMFYHVESNEIKMFYHVGTVLLDIDL